MNRIIITRVLNSRHIYKLSAREASKSKPEVLTFWKAEMRDFLISDEGYDIATPVR
jgi:hypothetical protein